jgi:hypothetical protein
MLDKGLGRFRANVAHYHGVIGFLNIGRHARTHVAETNESNGFHRRYSYLSSNSKNDLMKD